LEFIVCTDLCTDQWHFIHFVVPFNNILYIIYEINYSFFYDFIME